MVYLQGDAKLVPDPADLGPEVLHRHLALGDPRLVGDEDDLEAVLDELLEAGRHLGVEDPPVVQVLGEDLPDWVVMMVPSISKAATLTPPARPSSVATSSFPPATSLHSSLPEPGKTRPAPPSSQGGSPPPRPSLPFRALLLAPAPPSLLDRFTCLLPSSLDLAPSSLTGGAGLVCSSGGGGEKSSVWPCSPVSSSRESPWAAVTVLPLPTSCPRTVLLLEPSCSTLTLDSGVGAGGGGN